MIHKKSGFTLIELSIALVIIGLIVGGVLVGRDLIKAAEIRSLISQVDSFKLAANTFKEKYGQLPGDMHPTKAAQFGFFKFENDYAGINGYGDNNGSVYGSVEGFCWKECGAFWRHLSDAQLLAGNYGQTLIADTNTIFPGAPENETHTSPFSFSLYMPAAKGGFGYVGAGGLESSPYMSQIPSIDLRQNLFWVVPAAKVETTSFAEPNLSAMDSFTIDSKIDDGKPNGGKFIVSSFDGYNAVHAYWSNGILDVNSKVCTYGGADALQRDVEYNINPATGGNNKSCIPVFLW